MNHRQVEIDKNLNIIEESLQSIERSKQTIETERMRIKNFQEYIGSRKASNRQLKKHQMYDDGLSKPYCVECGYNGS